MHVSVTPAEWNNLLERATKQEGVLTSDGHKVLILSEKQLKDNPGKIINVEEIINLTEFFLTNSLLSDSEKNTMIQQTKLILDKESNKLNANENERITKLFTTVCSKWEKQSTSEKTVRDSLVQRTSKLFSTIIYPEKRPNPPSTILFHVALKGSTHPEVKQIAPVFSGTFPAELYHLRAFYANQLREKIKEPASSMGLNSLQEEAGLVRICQHRANFAKYQERIFVAPIIDDQLNIVAPTKDPNLIPDIQTNIDHLAPNFTIDHQVPSDVVELEDGSRTFSIPGGWRGGSGNHSISYEFLQKNGKFYFIIHNRGDKSLDPRFNLTSKFEQDGKTFSKTSTVIEITDINILKDKDFLNSLIAPMIIHEINYYSDDSAYYSIDKHLIKSGKGKIVLTDDDKQFTKLCKLLDHSMLNNTDKENIKKTTFRLIQGNPHYKSLQLYGTCTESNVTTPEDSMAPLSVRRALKIFTISGMINKIFKKVYKEDNLNLLKTHSINKLLELEQTPEVKLTPSFLEKNKDVTFQNDIDQLEKQINKNFEVVQKELDIVAQKFQHKPGRVFLKNLKNCKTVYDFKALLMNPNLVLFEVEDELKDYLEIINQLPIAIKDIFLRAAFLNVIEKQSPSYDLLYSILSHCTDSEKVYLFLVENCELIWRKSDVLFKYIHQFMAEPGQKIFDLGRSNPSQLDQFNEKYDKFLVANNMSGGDDDDTEDFY